MYTSESRPQEDLQHSPSPAWNTALWSLKEVSLESWRMSDCGSEFQCSCWRPVPSARHVKEAILNFQLRAAAWLSPRDTSRGKSSQPTELWEIISNSYHLLRLGWVLTQQQVTGADIPLLMVQSSWIPMQARSYNVEVRWRWAAAGGEGNQTHYIVGDFGVHAPGFQGHGPCSTYAGSPTRGKQRQRIWNGHWRMRGCR